MTTPAPTSDSIRQDAPPPMPPRRIALVALIFLVIPALGTLLSGRRPVFSDVDPTVGAAVGAAVLLRIGLLWRLGLRPWPWIDLPLLGLVFVATGGEDSPFDPALFLVYSLVALFLEREPGRLATPRFAALYGAGVVAMYAILVLFVAREHRERIAAQRAPLRVRAADPELAPPPIVLEAATIEGEVTLALRKLRDEGALRETDRYFDPASDSGFIADVRKWVAVLEARQAALRAGRAALTGDNDIDSVLSAEHALSAAFAATRRELVTLDARWRSALEDAVVQRSVVVVTSESLSALAAETTLIEAGLGRFEEVENAQDRAASALSKFALGDLASFERLEVDLEASRRSLVIERTSLAILAFATLALVAGLRAHYEEDVRRREAARVARDLERKQQETDNWIALTAGYTHTIGNDILAYDAVTEEALDALAAADGKSPQVVAENLRFIRASNKQRVGFIRFLDEFARMRKQRLEGRAFEPAALTSIDLEKLLRDERAHVGAVEVLDLPPSHADSRAARLRAKFADLPLEIRFDPDNPSARKITKGRAAVLQFFAYELFKNALRNCSGERPLRVEVEKKRDRVLLRFVNDLDVVTTPDPTAEGGILRRLPRRPERTARSERELAAIVDDVLTNCFEPHVGGGTGLGLFLIRYFVVEYYCGSIRARVLDPAAREVAFEVDVPDDLAHASRDSTETA
jgi:hypothetical protein